MTRITGEHLGAGQRDRGDVGAQRVECASVLLDEGDMSGTPGERFEPERTGSGEHVEHRSADESWREAREQCLLHPIGGRAHGGACWCDEPTSSRSTGHHAHQTTSSAESRNACTFASSRQAS